MPRYTCVRPSVCPSKFIINRSVEQKVRVPQFRCVKHECLASVCLSSHPIPQYEDAYALRWTQLVEAWIIHWYSIKYLVDWKG